MWKLTLHQFWPDSLELTSCIFCPSEKATLRALRKRRVTFHCLCTILRPSLYGLASLGSKNCNTDQGGKHRKEQVPMQVPPGVPERNHTFDLSKAWPLLLLLDLQSSARIPQSSFPRSSLRTALKTSLSSSLPWDSQCPLALLPPQINSNLDLPVLTRGVRAQPGPKTQKLCINKDQSAGVKMAQHFYSLSCGSLQTHKWGCRISNVGREEEWVQQNKTSKYKDK